MIVNFCILGASGIGKSPVDCLFPSDVVRIEPYRAREEGARPNEKYFVSPTMLEELLFLNRKLDQKPIVYLDSDKGNTEPYMIGRKKYRKWLEVYKRASFFTVRKTKQVLLHYEQEIALDCRKVEVFAPVLSLILENEDVRSALPFLQEAMTVFILLNPLTKSVRDINLDQIIDGVGWERKDWIKLQTKRNRLLGKDEKSSSVNERVDLLPLEAKAWQSLAKLTEQKPDDFRFVECLGWSHYEYKYLGKEDSEIAKELESAKSDILKSAQSVGLESILQKCML